MKYTEWRRIHICSVYGSTKRTRSDHFYPDRFSNSCKRHEQDCLRQIPQGVGTQLTYMAVCSGKTKTSRHIQCLVQCISLVSRR